MKDLLPSMEFEFEIKDLKGDDTGRIFNGKFKYKRLNIAQKSAAAKLKAELDGTFDIPIEVSLLHDMLSWLKYGLTEVPEWFDDSDYGMQLYDMNLIEHLYGKIIKFEDKWKKSLLKEEKKKSAK